MGRPVGSKNEKRNIYRQCSCVYGNGYKKGNSDDLDIIFHNFFGGYVIKIINYDKSGIRYSISKNGKTEVFKEKNMFIAKLRECLNEI